MKAQELIQIYKQGGRDFSGADLHDANLHRTYLRGADLSCVDLHRVNLRYADLSYADLHRVNLSCADLRETDLSYADLSYADLHRVDLSWANLHGSNLRGANLHRADLYFVNFSGADLSGTNLDGAVLSSTNFSGADLHCADLHCADLHCADLRGADLSGADLDNTILQYIKFDNAILSNTCLDPINIPNGECSEFKNFDSVWKIGYRTKHSTHVGNTEYIVGEEYSATVFSTSEKDCHPGLYVCPTVDAVKDFVGYTVEMVSVIFQPWNCHQAGKKYRVREFIVWEDFWNFE